MLTPEINMFTAWYSDVFALLLISSLMTFLLLFFLICSLATLLGTLIQMLVKANFTWQQLKAFRLVEMKDKLLKFKLNRKVI